MGLYILWGFGAYLLGSIPFGLVATHIFGTNDPRSHGSHNIGFTNVLRVSGKKVGFFTLVGDFGKGFFVPAMSGYLGFPWHWMLVFSVIVVLGHVFSIFLGFKGGKGVATGFGTVFGLHPVTGLVLVFIWISTVALFRYSSAGALGAFGIFPIFAYLLTQDPYFCIFAGCLLVIIYGAHKDNILRIINGTESQIR